MWVGWINDYKLINMPEPQRDLEFALIKFYFVAPQWAKSYLYAFFPDRKKTHLNGDFVGEKKPIFSTVLLGQFLYSDNFHVFIFVLVSI